MSDRTEFEKSQVAIGLSAAIVSVRDEMPVVLTVAPTLPATARGDALPFGPFSPTEHRTLDVGLRNWVAEQTPIALGYVEQLYTFGDRGRHARPGDDQPHVVSIGYLALTRAAQSDEDAAVTTASQWRSWYDYFPWEDWRRGTPDVLKETIAPRLEAWANRPGTERDKARPLARRERIRMAFAFPDGNWDEERVLDRYELLYEAGLVEEARRDGRKAAEAWSELPHLGRMMRFDHRRILATAIGRLRAKIKYRPVVFELMPDEFTLFELQKTVEAILGPHLHKQNFRRLVEGAGLVEPTGDVRAKTGGRPAKLFRFRREVLLERPAPGVRVKPGRS